MASIFFCPQWDELVYLPDARGTEASKKTPVRTFEVLMLIARPDAVDMVTKTAIHAGTSTRDPRNVFRWMSPANLPEFSVNP